MGVWFEGKRARGLRFVSWGLWLGVWGLGLLVWSLGRSAAGSGLRVCGFRRGATGLVTRGRRVWLLVVS